jgi:hypothetical protein
MISKAKIALIAALAVSVASPAFAQSFNNGTGHDRFAVHQNSRNHVAAPRSGLYDYATVPGAGGNSNSPALTGGGSTGYNTMVETY